MSARGTAIAALLAVVLAGGLGVAWFAAGRSVSAVPPLRAAPPVPAAGVGDTTVLLSADALTHPAHELVRSQLQLHYDAINRKDYQAWAATVVPARSGSLDQEAWLDAYGSTRDGTIRIDRIDDLEGARVLVRVRFVSTQAITDAPQDVPARRICWHSSLPMSGVPPLIELTGAGSSRAEAC
ncbi:hypothetical protein [Pseudonocardia sp.]|uniref:hypothetical protein n=1 Tax=Pseudonocardia sp. TaxID=60912 RepID=UPI00261F506E|nr:hypothetical protein [Pseudonocardia sp.]